MQKNVQNASQIKQGLCSPLNLKKKDNGMVVVTDPFFACATCEHAWQIKRVMVISKFSNENDISSVLDEL